MRIDRFLAPNRIIDLKSRDFQSALHELLVTCAGAIGGAISDDKIIEKILQRERTIPTHLDNSVSLPHVRIPLKKNYIFAVGRCPNGLPNSPDKDDQRVRIVFLVLASSEEKSYHSVLTTLARALEEKTVVARLENATSLKSFRTEIGAIFKGVAKRTSSFTTRLNRMMLREAEKIATNAKCRNILIFLDTFSTLIKAGKFASPNLTTILVTQHGFDLPADPDDAPEIINVRTFSSHRLAQMRSALLIGVMRGLIKPNDRACCVGGIPGSEKLDAIVLLNVADEFPSVLLSHSGNILPNDVKPEVFERALGIATELSIEGREGKPIGCILVIGNRNAIAPHTKPLILNPFFGYAEEDRNILSPFMDETVKELSSIDGAFIINSDGVIESAGSMLMANEHTKTLQGGLGTRHAAASGISVVADCIAIVVSSSTGQVTLFRNGEPLSLLERTR